MTNEPTWPESNLKQPEQILLVDDNTANLQVLRQTLGGRGYRLLIAKNGESGLSIARKAAPSLVLLDIMMPGIDGFEVCRRLKADPATEDIPVIFLSALDEASDKVHGLQLGAVDYISKPFQPEEVIARVNTHLTIHRLNQEVQNQRDQLEHELQVVSEVQRSLLPKQLPNIAELMLAVHYETSRYAGGDYYDIIELPDNRWGFLVADAEGHSAPATVLMAMTCALFRAYGHATSEPGEVLNYVNQNLCKVNESSFVTAIYVVYDSNDKTLRIARAGHPQPMIFKSNQNRAFELACDGVLPLGWESYDQVPVTEFELEKGDRLLLYTDGVTERFNKQGQAYGEERLLNQLEIKGKQEPRRVLETIIADLERFAGGRPTNDDQALLIGIVG